MTKKQRALYARKLRDRHTQNGVCYAHPKVPLVPGRKVCQQCLNTRSYYARQKKKERKAQGVCFKHPDRKVVSKTHCQECLDEFKQRDRKNRNTALQMIMEAHKLFECHKMIHPYIPEDLKHLACWGELWIEHPNGGGRKQDGPSNRLVREIVKGTKEPKNYMILCQLHQIWNQRKAQHVQLDEGSK